METKEKENLNPENEEVTESVEAVAEEVEGESAKDTEEKEGTQSQEQQAADFSPSENEEAQLSEDDEESAEDGGKKKLFGKKNKKDPKDDKIADLEDRVKRQMAEFENFRKRTDKEKSSMYEMGAKAVVEKILPVIDNFERGLAQVPEEGADSFAEGMKMIYKQLLTELDNLGVKPIEALGKEFDPNIHNAVMQVESEEYESGIVAQELQKGYMYRDSLVRPSMVAVVQ